MKKKLIVGICSYTGSNTEKVLQKLQRVIPCKIYSVLNGTSLEDVFDAISSSKKQGGIHIINRIHSVEEMFYTERVFPRDQVEFIGIDVHYEDRYEIMLRKGWIAKSNPKKWYDEFQHQECERNIRKCFERITAEFRFRYQEGSQNQVVGEIADLFVRM